MARKWMSFSELATHLGCARLTARNRVEDGTIPGGVTLLGRLRIKRGVVENWLKKQPLDK